MYTSDCYDDSFARARAFHFVPYSDRVLLRLALDLIRFLRASFLALIAITSVLKLKCLYHVSEPPVGRFATRRKSVFAETYNPEEDEEDDGFKVCASVSLSLSFAPLPAATRAILRDKTRRARRVRVKCRCKDIAKVSCLYLEKKNGLAEQD